MIWVLVVLGAVVWLFIGTEVLMAIDRHEGKVGNKPIDPADRGDRGMFRMFTVLWPVALVVYGILSYNEYREKHPTNGRIKGWFKGGGVTHWYINWRSRR